MPRLDHIFSHAAGLSAQDPTSRQTSRPPLSQSSNPTTNQFIYPEAKIVSIRGARSSSSLKPKAGTAMLESHRPRSGGSDHQHSQQNPSFSDSSREVGTSSPDSRAPVPPQDSYARNAPAAASASHYVRTPPPPPPSRRTQQVTEIVPAQAPQVNGNRKACATPQILVEPPTPSTWKSAPNDRAESMPSLYPPEEFASHWNLVPGPNVRIEGQKADILDNEKWSLQPQHVDIRLPVDYDDQIDVPAALDARNTTPTRPPKQERLKQIPSPVPYGNTNGNRSSRASYEPGDDRHIDVYRPDFDVVDDNANWDEEPLSPRRNREIAEAAETAVEFFHRVAKEKANKIETSILSPGLLFAVDTTNWAHIHRKAPPEMQRAGSARLALREAVILHAKLGILDTSPLISLTAELTRAFSNAKELARTGHVGVRIIIVDTRMMEPGSLVVANYLRRRLRLEENDSSISEVFAWEGVPENSLLFTWSWKDILDSKLAKQYFPAIAVTKERPCCIECEAKNGCSLSFRNPDVQTADLVIALISQGMPPNKVLILHMVESFLALSRGETCLRHYKESERWPRMRDHVDIERWLSIATTWISYMDLDVAKS